MSADAECDACCPREPKACCLGCRRVIAVMSTKYGGEFLGLRPHKDWSRNRCGGA